MGNDILRDMTEMLKGDGYNCMVLFNIYSTRGVVT